MKTGATTLSVLVVDDEPMIRFGISRCLKDCAAVRTVASAEEALEEIGARHYDLCLLDVCLPGMNGLDAMRKISEMSPKTKVAIMTGNQLDEVTRQRIQDEAYAFITKPFEISRIREIAKGIIIGGDENKRPDTSAAEAILDPETDI